MRAMLEAGRKRGRPEDWRDPPSETPP